MTPTTTDVEDRDQWRARITRALAELQTHADHIDPRVSEERDAEGARAEV